MERMIFRLKELRIEKGCTQKELADAVKTTADSIYSWEKGRSQPSIETLAKLADFFGCSIDYLAGREDDFGVIQTPSEYSPKAQELLGIFEKLDPLHQTQVLEYARYFGARSEGMNSGKKI